VTFPVLDRGGRDAKLGSGLANPANLRDHLGCGRHEQSCTASVHEMQALRTKFSFALNAVALHQAAMRDAEEILEALKQRGVKQERIAEVLGIARPNVTRLYAPDPRTGKKRTLSYDEGQTLIETFGLDQDDDGQSVEPMSVPVARLAVQYVAQQLGVKIDPDDARVEDLAQDIRAYSEFAASSQIGENLDRAEGWLDGRRSRAPGRA
jgi:hypothetical protein